MPEGFPNKRPPVDPEARNWPKPVTVAPSRPPSVVPPPMPAQTPGSAIAHASIFSRARRLARKVARPLYAAELLLSATMRRAGLRPVTAELTNGRMRAWVARSIASQADEHVRPRRSQGKHPEPDDRPVLLLLHGFGSDAVWQWHPQVGPLGATHRLVVPDLLYFGESVGRHADYSLDYQYQACLQLMDHLGVETFDVVGISFGGLVACELASHAPDRVSRLVVSNSCGPVYEHADYERARDHFGVSHFNELLLPEEPNEVRRLLDVAWHRPPPIPGFALNDAHQTLFSSYRNEKAATMSELIDRIESPELKGRNVDQDTLLLWGEHDRIFDVGVAKRLREHVGPTARLHVIANAAHSPNQEHPGEYNRVLGNFLAGRPLAHRAKTGWRRFRERLGF